MAMVRNIGRVVLAAVVFGTVFSLSAPAIAQPAAPPAKPEMTEACPGLVAADEPAATFAALRLAALNPDQVRLTFVGHATFRIESPQLVRIATDYNDYVKPPVLPDIVTMNSPLHPIRK
jgi:hypothetical protein